MKIWNFEVSERRLIWIVVAVMLFALVAALAIAHNNPQIFKGEQIYTTSMFGGPNQSEMSANGPGGSAETGSREYTMYGGGKVGLETDFGEHGEGNAEIEIEMDMAEITNVALYTSYTNIAVASAADPEQRYPILKIEGDERTQYNYSKFHGEFRVVVHPHSVSVGKEGTNRELTLILPQSYRSEVFVQEEAGNVEIKGDFSSVSAAVETGNIRIDGNISQIKVDSELGNVEIQTPDADAIEVDADMGNTYFEGSLSRGHFDCDKGNLELSLTKLPAGTVEIDADMGSTLIQVPKKDDVYFSVTSSLGSVSIFDGEEIRAHDKTTYGSQQASAKFLIDSDAGNVTVKLKK